MHITWRQSVQWFLASRRYRPGCTECLWFSAGTRPWLFFSTRFTSLCYCVLWLLREYSFLCRKWFEFFLSWVLLISFQLGDHKTRFSWSFNAGHPDCRERGTSASLSFYAISALLTPQNVKVQRQATEKLRQQFSNPEMNRPIEMRPIDSSSRNEYGEEDARGLRQRRAEPL